MARLDISPELSLPLAAATQTFGILAKKGAGKSNAAVVLAEQLYDAGVAWVAIDPKGDWYGVRSSADGKGPGLPIPVFGGRHGDIPLEATAGALVADLVNEKGLTCVLDVSEFSKADQRRFLIAFGDRLYRARSDDADVVHLFLEEAHEYLPQRVMRDETQVVNTWGRIVKQGRFRGLGCTLISQRSASLNKDVLTQVDTLIVLRTTAPQDRKAVLAWVEEHDVGHELVGSLPGLEDGEAWVWSPEFLRATERIHFHRRHTFDSGATPEVGKSRRAPATLADVDLASIKEQMAETIEKAKADDPKELHKRIKELEKELQARPAERVEVEVPVEVPVLSQEDSKMLGDVGRQVLELSDCTSAMATTVSTALSAIMERFSDRPDVPRAGRARDRARAVADRPRSDRAPQRPDPPTRREPRRPTVQGTEAAGELGGGAPAKILAALAQHHPEPLSQRRLAALVGVKQKTSTMRNALSKLRGLGYVTGSGYITVTDDGLAAAPAGDTLPTGPELLDHWRTKLGDGAPRRILDALVGVFPATLEPDELAERADVEAGTSTLRNAMSKLRSLGLVDGWDVAEDFVEAAEL